MADSAARTEPVVTRRPRQQILDWTSDLDAGERKELEALRAAAGDRDHELAALRREVADTRRRLNDYRAALCLLHRTRAWKRPGVWREIRERGMLDSVADSH